MRLSSNSQQTGIAVLETAAFMAIIAVIGIALFGVGGGVLTRYSVDSVIEAALSESATLQFSGRLAKPIVTGNGEIHYQYNSDAAHELVERTMYAVEHIKQQKSFLSTLPFHIVVSAYQLAINDETGKPVGFTGADIRKVKGALSVPGKVLSKHSVTQMHSEVSRAMADNVSAYAEPTGLVVYQSGGKKYVPFTPIVTVCLYVSDSFISSMGILESAFPEGVVASCQSTKVRDFI